MSGGPPSDAPPAAGEPADRKPSDSAGEGGAPESGAPRALAGEAEPAEGGAAPAGDGEAPESGAPVAGEAAPAAEDGSSKPWWRRLGRGVLNVYATVDPRSLGLLRLLLGAVLFVDLARRYPTLVDHLSNEGWLPNHFSLFRPMSNHGWSLYHAFSTPGEVRVLFFLHLAVNFCFFIGWRTKLMQVLAAVLLISVSSRTILMENGGWVVLILITVWSMFLPLGRRFSVDSLLRSLRARRETSAAALNDAASPQRDVTPVVSIAVTALLLQWVVIYFFNAVHKTGAPWKDGTAVYYFLQQDRMVSVFGGWLSDRMPLWGYQGMSWGALAVEFALPVLLLTPLFTRRARMLAWLLIIGLHLSIDVMVVLGPFSWAMMVMLAAFVHRDDWAWLAARQKKKRAARVVYFDADNGLTLQLCRLIKRLDGHGLVRFVPSSDARGFAVGPALASAAGPARVELAAEADDGAGDTGSGAARSQSEPGSAEADVANEGAAVHGVLALRSLSQALSLPRVSALWLYLPGLSQLTDAVLTRVLRRRDHYARVLGFGELVHAPDEVAPPPSGLERLCAGVRHWFTQVVVAYLMFAATTQVLVENRAVPEKFKPKQRPEWLEATIVYPRMFQGWSMFAPQPPGDDGVIVVDALTRDGRRVDPLTGKPPTFEMDPVNGYHLNQLWCDWQRRFGENRFRAYLPGVKDYLLRYHERTGNPGDELVAFEVWSLNERVPPPGAPQTPPNRNRLLSHGNLPEPLEWKWEPKAKSARPSPSPRTGRAPPRLPSSGSPQPAPDSGVPSAAPVGPTPARRGLPQAPRLGPPTPGPAR